MPIDQFLFNSPGMQFTEKTLQMQMRRLDLIAGNMANLETPKYEGRDLDFRELMERADTEIGIPLLGTDPRHLADAPYSENIVVKRAGENPSRVDGNTVDLDAEMNKLAKTQLMYEAGMKMVEHKLSMIRNAARSF